MPKQFKTAFDLKKLGNFIQSAKKIEFELMRIAF